MLLEVGAHFYVGYFNTALCVYRLILIWYIVILYWWQCEHICRNVTVVSLPSCYIETLLFLLVPICLDIVCFGLMYRWGFQNWNVGWLKLGEIGNGGRDSVSVLVGLVLVGNDCGGIFPQYVSLYHTSHCIWFAFLLLPFISFIIWTSSWSWFVIACDSVWLLSSRGYCI